MINTAQIGRIDVERISPETYVQAMRLVNDHFTLRDDENPELELREAISPGSCTRELADIGIINPVYWVMKQGANVIGLSGIYSTPNDSDDTVWGGWTVFNSDVLSSVTICKFALCVYQVKMAFKTGKTYFKIYTSTLPSESQANRFYDRVECNVYKREPCPDGSYEILFREFHLPSGYPKYCAPYIKRLNVPYLDIE